MHYQWRFLRKICVSLTLICRVSEKDGKRAFSAVSTEVHSPDNPAFEQPDTKASFPSPGTISIQIQNDLADIALLIKGILGGADLLKLKGFSDQRRDVAAFDPLDKIAEDIWTQYRATEEA